MVKPNKYGTNEIQNELLDIIKIFHKFCDDNDINYFLCGGSCLGAVRHKGFIPWDDDLDICLDRHNYYKLLSLFKTCKDLKMNKTLWVYRIQKVKSITIRNYIPTLDVFIYDNVPNNEYLFKLKIFLISLLQGMLKENISYKNYSPINKVLVFTTHFMSFFFSKNILREWYDSVSKIGNDKPSDFIHCANTLYSWIRKKYPSNTFDERELVPFEDTFLYIPKNYDAYLKIAYGNYMELPDEKDRVPEHVKKD